MAPLLSITGLRVSVEGTEIIRGLDLTIQDGEIHAVMGPNGSGKSTLANTLMGHPRYTVTAGSVLYQGKDLLTMKAHERAQAGMFLAFQYPKEIAGVSLRSFLFAACKAQTEARDPSKKIVSPIKFKKTLEESMIALHMDPAFAERPINKGFSGGEKKKAEVLQMHMLKPILALMDETDSGLDVDALKIVAEGVQAMRLSAGQAGSSAFSALVVTHYARILEYLKPDFVHVLVQGRLEESGGPELAYTLEKEGYAKYGVTE